MLVVFVLSIACDVVIVGDVITPVNISVENPVNEAFDPVVTVLLVAPTHIFLRAMP
jgi:hypothetical protein